MQLRPGTRLSSSTCTTEVIVVKAPAGDVDLCCGGHPMVAAGSTGKKISPDGGFGDGTAMGKRYGTDESGLEILCTKPGAGGLSIGAEILPIKGAKPLPSSD